MRSQLTNPQVGIVLDVQTWSEKLYPHPDVVERIGSYLGTSFPLFYASLSRHGHNITSLSKDGDAVCTAGINKDSNKGWPDA